MFFSAKRKKKALLLKILWSGQIIYFHHGLGRQIYFRVIQGRNIYFQPQQIFEKEKKKNGGGGSSRV